MSKHRESSNETHRIRRHFIVSVLMIVALLIVIPLITVYLLTQAYDDQIRAETEQTSFALQQTVDSFMDRAYSLSFELSVNPGILSMDAEVQTAILADTAGRNDYMELLYVTAMDGMQLARSSGQCGDRSSRFWYIRIMETRRPFVSHSYYSVTTSKPCTSVYIPMYEGPEMIGIFGADISLGYIQQLTEQFTNPGSGRFSFVIDGEGVVIAHPDSTYLETLTNYKTMLRTVSVLDESGNPVLNPDGSVVTAEEEFTVSDGFRNAVEAVMSGTRGLDIVEDGNSVFYMSYEPISLPGYSDSWSVITLQDRAVAMRVITRLVTQVLLIIVLILIVFIVLILAFFKSLRNTLNYLENARNEADQANKSKSNFLATMSHEIRTPMNAIIGITQIQLQKDDLPEEYHEVMSKIYVSGKSLLGIINDILDMSRIETGKLDLNPVEYDVPSLINDTVQLNIVRIGEKRIEFLLDADERLPARLYGDELRIKQILNNLLSNAIKYTKEGFVKLSIKHSGAGEDVILHVCVEDTGQGISQNDKVNLFSEYLRFNAEANRTTEGTGLGLTITKKLVEMMNGAISVESEIGKGSAFTVTVRQKAVKCEEIGKETSDRLNNFMYMDGSRAADLRIERESMPYGRVLVVDDVEINLYVAEGVLQAYDLNIDLAESGYAALEKVQNGRKYDVIFMDHMMPKMDGIVTTQKLREFGYTGTIIALTANALVGNEEMFAQNGFDGFIAKPIDIRHMDEILNKFIRDKHLDEAAGGFYPGMPC